MRATHVVLALFWFLSIHTPGLFCANVQYDHRALVIDGKRRVLISGSIHYPRSTPEMWPDLIQKSKDGGLDMIETYVFWNIHEPVRGQYDFDGRKDLVKFVKTVAAAGLYVHLRIGPYVCAEWNYGGFPVWLHFIPGIKFRTDNEPFKAEMKRFTAKIVDMMKQEKLYASQGGPIILSQIENEYGNIDSSYGAAGKSYIKWAATMATSLDTGVPWVMCQQADAPDPIINTCNGFYCDQFTPNSNTKPKMWTENWSGWFLSFGGAVPFRPVEDLAFAVARFFQRGGTFQNYYMYHGGTNFDRTSGGPFIATSYDYDAPIDEYGIVRQPKWGHLKDVHKAIKLCEEALIATDPSIVSLGPNLEAAVYKTGSVCSAFLANVGTTSDATVNFSGNSYHLPAWSVSILPDCKNVVLNTAKINSASSVSSFTKESSKEDAGSSETSSAGWSWISEPVGISKADPFSQTGLLEQINTTADKSDYLWYSLSIDHNYGASSQTSLHIESLGHGLHAFINGKLAGSQAGNSGKAKFTVDIPVTLVAGKNTIDLLSLTVGLQNYGAFFDLTGAGITGPVILKGLANASALDLSSQKWTYQVGLKGEDLGLSSGSSGQWNSQSTFPKNQPLTWYKTTFAAPSGTSPVAIDFTGMRKGEAWVNGQSIGRYWPIFVASDAGCTESCNYRGPYSASKCRRNCGKPSQTLYHVPRSWLKPRTRFIHVPKKNGRRGTRLKELTVSYSADQRLPIQFDMQTGKALGDNSTKFTSYVALLGRSKSSILIDDWDHVLDTVKNQIWLSVQVTYDVPNSNMLRTKWISFAGERWKGFKTNLTSSYIYGPLSDRNPCEKYPFLDEDIWQAFKERRLNPVFQAKRKAAQEIAKKNVHPHRLSRGGYDKLEQKMMKEACICLSLIILSYLFYKYYLVTLGKMYALGSTIHHATIVDDKMRVVVVDV